MGGDIQIDAETEKAYSYMEATYKDKWSDATWDRFNNCYTNYFSSDIDYSEDYAQQRLMQERNINIMLNEYERKRSGENAVPIPFYTDSDGNSYNEDERLEMLRREERELYRERCSEYAVMSALGQLQSEHYIQDEVQEGFLDDWAKLNQQAQVDEAIAALADRVQLNLVRGAYLKCDCGSHYRMLNLMRDHGVTVKNIPEINVCDAKPGVQNQTDGYNIGWFGHCSAPSHSLEKVRLKPFTQVDMKGTHLQPQENRTAEAYKCEPLFGNEPRWKTAGENLMKFAIDYQLVATLTSYIICRRGGIVYPVSSGQDDVYMYVPEYAECPFITELIEKDREDENSNFMQWCRDNNKCPYDPGTPQFDEWFNNEMQNLRNNGKLDWQQREAYIADKAEALAEYDKMGDEYYEQRQWTEELYDDLIENCTKAGYELYQRWLIALVQSGAAYDATTIERINNATVNDVRESYYSGSPYIPASFEQERNAERATYGSNSQS